MEKVGVVGAGVMGSDIAALFANSGYEVVLIDIDERSLEKAKKRIVNNPRRMLNEAGLLRNSDFYKNIHYTTEIGALQGCFFILETIKEVLEDKQKVVKQIEEIANEKTIIGTNTSSYTPKEIASVMKHPERFVYFHFSNPPILRNVVEISGEKASKKALEVAINLARQIGKEAFVLKKEARGHVMSRLRAALLVGSALEVYFSNARPEDVDHSLRKFGLEKGAFEWCDIIGLDVVIAVHRNLKEVYGSRFGLPEELENQLQEMINSGKLGRKSGEGFYKWIEDEPVYGDDFKEINVTPILLSVLNEGFRIAEDGIADERTINLISKLGSAANMGVFDLGKAIGYQNILNALNDLYQSRSMELYKPSKLLTSHENGS